jgi:hypothetical protein
MNRTSVKTYCFDIDGTICTNTDGEYASAKPFESRIDHINALYDSGHTISFFTAKGVNDRDRLASSDCGATRPMGGEVSHPDYG